MLVVVEGVALPDVGRNATDGEVHARQLEGGVGVLLPIHAHVLLVAVVRLHKLQRLHEHATGAATGVIYLAIVWLNEFSNEIHDRLRRVIFPLALAFRNGELAQEILIHPPDKVILGIFNGVEFVNLVKQRGKFRLIQAQVRIVVVGKCPR